MVFIPIIQSNIDIDKIWFLQNGARPHRTKKGFYILEEYFGDRILALEYAEDTKIWLAWTSYSPDMNTCDSFLWIYIKGNEHRKNIKSIAKLKTAIQEAIDNDSIKVPTLQQVMQNFAVRLHHIIVNDDSHIEIS